MAGSGANPDMWMTCEKLDNALYARLDAIGALRRMLGNVVEDQAEIGKCRGRVANLHRPCLAQMERTCSSVANSPRAAAALELAMAVRSVPAPELAAAVKSYLVSLGISADRMTTTSLGKERPFCTESNEECWQKNRVGHFVKAN